LTKHTPENAPLDAAGRNFLRRIAYIIRNKLSEYYYCCQNDIEELSQTKSEEEFKDAMVDNYFDRTLAMYNELGKIIFSSRYFLFLPQTQRESIQDTFDYVLLQKAYATSIISEQGGIPHEETILMIKDLLDLFDNITQEINRINELVEHTEDQ
jgi:hypothetical protein